MVQNLGILYGISVGTGDPELITIKGLKILQRLPVVAFPRGVGEKKGYAEEIISSWLKPAQKKLSLHFPYVKSQEILEQAWTEAALEVWKYLKQGQEVAFACEGDVSFYSTFTYLAQKLKQLQPEVMIQSIPGVCSPIAATAMLGIPLTVSNQRLAVLPALYSVQELESVLGWAQVIVLMKVSSVYQEVWQILEQYQLLEHSWVVEWATTPHQVTYRGLGAYPNLKLSYFSILGIEVKTIANVKKN